MGGANYGSVEPFWSGTRRKSDIALNRCAVEPRIDEALLAHPTIIDLLRSAVRLDGGKPDVQSI